MDGIVKLDNGFIGVGRDAWGAKHSPGRTPMPQMVYEVNIHHTVTLLTGGGLAYDGKLDATDDPCRDMRTVEGVLNERGLAPGYSYCFHPSGTTLEGAGLMKGAHTSGRNGLSYGLSLMGNFDIHGVTYEQPVAMARVINMLRLAGRLPAKLDDLSIKLHRDHKATACPGAHAVRMPLGDGRWGTIADVVRWYAALGI